MRINTITEKTKQLVNLIKVADRAIKEGYTDLSIMVEYLGKETIWLEDLSPKDAITFNKYLNNDELYCSALIDEIATLNEQTVMIARIKRKLSDIIANSQSDFLTLENILLNCIKENYNNLNVINEKLRYVFYKLCEDEKFSDILKFVHMEYINRTPDIKNISYDEITYCYDLTKLIINRLGEYNDSELNNSATSRIINNYLILLRSVFIIVNNYDILINTEEYYNQVITQTKIKELVKNALIANYNDEKKLRL